MGMIARDDKQLTLLYSSTTRVGKHTLSYLTGIDKPYLAIDLVKTKLPGSQWVEIAKEMNVKVGDLVDKRQLGLDENTTHNFNTEDWIKIIQNNDNAISRPIVISGKITKQIANPPEIMEFFDVDSAGLNQTPSPDNSAIDIEKTTEGEDFIEPK